MAISERGRENPSVAEWQRDGRRSDSLLRPSRLGKQGEKRPPETEGRGPSEAWEGGGWVVVWRASPKRDEAERQHEVLERASD